MALEVVEAVEAPAEGTAASFRTLSVHEARALVLYGIERRYPVQVLVGRAGTGKSGLVTALGHTRTPGAEIVVASTAPTSLEVTTRLLAARLDVTEVAGESAVERLARVADALAERRRRGRLVALVLDDAHLLGDTALGDIRLLAGTDAAGGALLPIVLAGRPELAARLEEPVLEPLRRVISTRIELARPAPARPCEVPEREPAAAGAAPAAPVQRSRWHVPALLPALGVVLLVVTLRPGLPLHPRGTDAGFATASLGPPRHDSAPRGRPAPVPPPRLGMTPAPARDRLPQPPLRGAPTAEHVRRLVDDFARAVGDADLGMLESLLARDARQNGMRGRDPILDAYAYRFSRLDTPTRIGDPTRIEMRDGGALVDAPFTAGYRDASGEEGVVSGTLHMRVARRRDRLVLDSVDYDFASDAR